jgi:hypothetical protein
MAKRQKFITFLVLVYICSLCTSSLFGKNKKELIYPTTPANETNWSISVKGDVLEIAYRTGDSYLQYAALHLNDSYFRMVYGPQSIWGTSAIIMPSFWENGELIQGAPVSYSHHEEGPDIIISLTGSISSLDVDAEIQISPPDVTSITALVSVSVDGNVNLDHRPGEAFKLVTLSSMHISPYIWDCCCAFADSSTFYIPLDGWIIQPPVVGRVFGLEGGTSFWKTNAPTMEVHLSEDVNITGWVTPKDDPNEDNVGFWGATDNLVRFWEYTLISRPRRADESALILPIFDGHDFNDDDTSDVSVWRPTNGKWYIRGIGTYTWGQSGDIPVNGDYDGDGTTDIAVWRPTNGKWYIRGIGGESWGTACDIPVPDNYDGDVNGMTDIAVWRPSNGRWYIKGVGGYVWGTMGDIPVPGDYNGDGTTEIAVWRPSDGRWYIKGVAGSVWGMAGDIPVPADYNGDGVTDIAVWRPANGRWYIKGMAGLVWGTMGDVPTPGDYNGDGITDIAVWRPSNGRWYIKGVGGYVWGIATDIPLVR